MRQLERQKELRERQPKPAKLPPDGLKKPIEVIIEAKPVTEKTPASSKKKVSKMEMFKEKLAKMSDLQKLKLLSRSENNFCGHR